MAAIEAAAVSMGPGCVVRVPPGTFVTFGGIVAAGLRDTVVTIDGKLELQFSTTLWPGCAAKDGKCASFMDFVGATNLTITSAVHFPQPFPKVPSRAWLAGTTVDGDNSVGLAAPIHPIRTAGIIDGKGSLWWDWKLLTGKKCPSPLIRVSASTDVLLEQLQVRGGTPCLPLQDPVVSSSVPVALTGSTDGGAGYGDALSFVHSW